MVQVATQDFVGEIAHQGSFVDTATFRWGRKRTPAGAGKEQGLALGRLTVSTLRPQLVRSAVLVRVTTKFGSAYRRAGGKSGLWS